MAKTRRSINAEGKRRASMAVGEKPVRAATSAPGVPELSRAAHYALLRAMHPEWQISKCKSEAGYSARTPTRDIVATQDYVRTRQTIDQQRLVLQQATPTSLPAMAGVVAQIAHNNDAKPGARIQAVRTAAELLDYNSPRKVAAKVDQTVRGLFVELSGLSRDDLEALAQCA